MTRNEAETGKRQTMINRRRLGVAAASAALLALAPLSAAKAQTGSLDKIKARGTLRAGVKYDTPPFGFLDDKNEPAGFDLDIVRAVADKIGVKVEFVKVTSPTRVPMLVSGNVDLVAASMTHTRERDKVIDFSITYYTGGQSLMVPADSSVTGLKDLDGKEVAVQQGTTLEKNIAAAAPKAKVTAFKDYDSAWLALAQGRVDALTGSLNILQGFQNNNPKFKIVGGLFSVEPFGIGVRQGDSDLRDAVNFALQDLWTSGEYTTLYRKWFHADPTVPIETWP
jgi:ABC-type amino acid transport substrate-binding protein